MASSSGGTESMEKVSKPPMLISPLKRLAKKLSGSASGVKRKSHVKSLDVNMRVAKASGLSHSFGIASTSKKFLSGRQSLKGKEHEPAAGTRMFLNLTKHAVLAKRLNASRLGTVRSGVDNKFHLSKTKILKREKIKDSRHPGLSENAVEMSVERNKDIECDDTFVRRGHVNELKDLFGRSCETEYEMYQILDERDKILSKARVRSAHVEDANVIQGTCMDMCPEKERYLRVVQKRINPYECNAEGKMMAEITVKDYSRSAADQEEPLPHELRPAEVLSRTMNYLIGKIANEVPSKDEELCVWYDFLWNRTRAIRKDITQQMMVNETAVMLNEQCARFHIFAAHRLCKLDNNEFDQKMNTENLSKCLQSLRHLYEDLGKKGVYCKSEAEFRAYDIMLNLADSYISSQVLSYRPEIRTSSVVKFALQLFSSYQSGNYRRFFKLLLEKADYLQCCVCHRYFSAFREQSLSTIVEAYTASGSAFARFPLHKLTGLLGFDDDDQSREMARFYGFECKLDPDCKEEYVLLSRSEFVQPKERPVLMHSWIEKKKDFTSLSKILSGGIEVTAQSWEPVVSFKNGLYCNDPVVNEFITSSSLDDRSDVFDSSEGTTHEENSEDRNILVDVAGCEQTFLDIVISELIENEVLDIVVRTFSSFTVDAATRDLFERLCDVVIGTACDSFMKRIEFKKHNKRLLEKKIWEVAHISDELSAEFIDKTVLACLRKVCNRFFNEIVVKQRMLDDLAVQLFKDLSTETIRSAIRISCKNALTESAQIFIKCSEIRNRLDRLWLRQFFHRWRVHVLKKKLEFEKVQQVLHEFPVVLPVKANMTIRQAVQPLKNCVPWTIEQALFKEKLEARRQMRSEELARRVFFYWHSWTKQHISRASFLKSFIRNPFLSTKKRRFSLRSGYDLAVRHKLLLNEERFDENNVLNGSSLDFCNEVTEEHHKVEEDVRIALCDIDAIATPRKKWRSNMTESNYVNRSGSFNDDCLNCHLSSTPLCASSTLKSKEVLTNEKASE